MFQGSEGMSKDHHTLLVRIDPAQAKKLKMIAAFEDTSMSELVRQAVGKIVTDREKRKSYRQLFGN